MPGDEDFFKTTSENEYNEYMNQRASEEQDLLLGHSNEIVNPSANPISELHQSESDLSRHVPDNIGDSSVVINLHSLMVQGKMQKKIVRNKA